MASNLGDWLRLLPRYVSTRPLAYRVVGSLGVAYTVVVAVDDATALKRWLFGLAVALIGLGWRRAALRLSARDLERYRARGEGPLDALLGLLLSRVPLPVARRIELLMATVLLIAGCALAVSSVFAL